MFILTLKVPILFHCKHQYQCVYPVICLLQPFICLSVFVLYPLPQGLTVSDLVLIETLPHTISLVLNKTLLVICISIKFLAYKTGIIRFNLDFTIKVLALLYIIILTFIEI